jgi:PKD repeat protein
MSERPHHMDNPSGRPRRRLTAALRVLLLACGAGIVAHGCTTSTVTGVDGVSVEVEPADVTLAAGEEIVLAARVRDEEGATVPGAQVDWSSDAVDVVAVGADGRVQALRAGSGTVTATFQGATGRARVTVLPGTEIAISRDSVLLFADASGTPPEPVVLEVTNAGTGTLEGLVASVEYEDGSGWLSPGLNASEAPALLTLVSSADGLGEGEYRADVVLEAAEAPNSPLRIPVLLTVTRGQAILSPSRSDLGVAVRPEAILDGSVSILVGNRGGGGLGAVSARALVEPGMPGGWLSTELVESDEETRVEVGLDPTGLGEGVYRGAVRLEAEGAANSPLDLPVTLTVSPDAPPLAGFSLAETGDGTSVAEAGGGDTVRVVLDARPETQVVLHVASAEPGEVAVEPDTIRFLPNEWDQPRSIVLTGMDDDVHDGDRTATVTVSVVDLRSDRRFQLAADRTVAVTSVDDDTPPTATITGPAASTFVQGESVTFTGEGTDREDGVLARGSLVWTSDRQSPSRLGTGTRVTRSDLAVGNHTIRLTVTDSDGNTASDVKRITVEPPPQDPPEAGFTVTCRGPECSFTDTSTDSDGEVVSWAWDFGDGATSAERNPTHTFPGDGRYTVRLTVTDDAGARDSVTREVEISGRPSAAFSVACGGLTCRFTDNSFDPDGSIEAWQWSFGDGTTSDEPNPTHAYETGGRYTVTLTVTDDDGRTSAPGTTEVEVNAPPRARFEAECERFACSFRESSEDPDGEIVAWSWDFDDGSGSDEREPSHSYATGGTYEVRLTVTDDDGATDTATRTVRASAPPTASFTVSCDGLACTFTDTSTDPGGSIVSRSWDFGDDEEGSGATVSHTYRSGGDYTVTLDITDDDGEGDQATRTVSVNEPPEVDFEVECEDDGECEFEDESEDPDGEVVAWSWDFGDGATSSDRNPEHTYEAGGTYEVRLTVTDDDGTSRTATRSVEVDGPPRASFTTSCDRLECTFRDTSIDPGGRINLRIWGMGDGRVRFGRTVTYRYRTPGTYTVSLVVVDDDGNRDTAEQTVTVTDEDPDGGG